jgi:hypothetical protein
VNAHHSIGAGQLQRRKRHPVDNRAFLILDDCRSTCGANASQTFRAVSAHSREDDSDHGVAKGFRGGSEEWIRGRPHSPDCGRRVVEVHRGIARATRYCHVKTARSKVDMILENSLTVNRLGHRKMTH